jgi:hypothetical protein
MAGVCGLEYEYGVGLSIRPKTCQMCEGRVRTEAVVGVIGACLEPAGGNDQPLTGELGTDPLPTATGGNGCRKLVRKFVLLGRPASTMNSLKASEKGVWRFGRSGRRSLTAAILSLERYGERHANEPLSGPTRRDRMESVRPAHLDHRPAAHRAWGAAGARAIRPVEAARFPIDSQQPARQGSSHGELAGFDGPYEPEVDPDLAEWFYGNYEGRTSKEIWQTHPGWTIWSGDVPGGESTTRSPAGSIG